MEIGLIGVGAIGGTLARHLVRAGHQVVLAGHEPRRAAALAHELGHAARAVQDPVEAAAPDLVVLAVPGTALEGLLDGLAPALAGTVVVDTTNPYGVQRGEPQGRWLADRLPGARVVRAFNTLQAQTLADAAFRDGQDRVAVALSGDDARALAVVAEVATELGLAPVVVGDLASSARQDPDGELYGVELPEQRMRDLVGLSDGPPGR